MLFRKAAKPEMQVRTGLETEEADIADGGGGGGHGGEVRNENRH